MAERLDSRPGIGVSQACSLDKGLAEFTASLLARGHPPSTITIYTNAARHLVRWLREHHRGIRSLTERTVEEFLFNHLPTCKCPAPALRDSPTLRAAVRRFRLFVKLRQEAGRPAAQALSPLERELRDYHDHLRDTCGLAEATCTYRMRYAREFMGRVAPGMKAKPIRITAREVVEHVTRRAKGVKTGTIRVIADSIRSYLRWLQLRGLVDAHLVSAVPRIPQWRLTEIPKALSETQLRQLLRSFDLRSPSGRRDLAMALCMAEMGLRASEVAKLTLADIDWRQGTIKDPRHEMPTCSTIAAAVTTRSGYCPLPAARTTGHRLPAALSSPHSTRWGSAFLRDGSWRHASCIRTGGIPRDMDGHAPAAAHRRDSDAPEGSHPQGDRGCPRSHLHRHHRDLHQGQSACPEDRGASVAGGEIMNGSCTMQERVEQYVSARRKLGYQMRVARERTPPFRAVRGRAWSSWSTEHGNRSTMGTGGSRLFVSVPSKET